MESSEVEMVSSFLRSYQYSDTFLQMGDEENADNADDVQWQHHVVKVAYRSQARNSSVKDVIAAATGSPEVESSEEGDDVAFVQPTDESSSSGSSYEESSEDEPPPPPPPAKAAKGPTSKSRKKVSILVMFRYLCSFFVKAPSKEAEPDDVILQDTAYVERDIAHLFL
jgi:hypothetical protein